MTRHTPTQEGHIAIVGNAVSSAKTLMLEAANGTLTNADRASIASQLQGVYETVLRRADDAAQVKMSRHGNLGPYAVSLHKTIMLERGSGTLEISPSAWSYAV